MAAHQATHSTASSRPGIVNGVRGKTSVRNEGPPGDPSLSATQIAHTLTACTRCRLRKTRCDPALPRCGPCERTNSICEYYDAAKGHNVSRNYVVYLQHKVRELEEELARTENEDSAEDPQAMMRAATVRVHDGPDTKFLGPSSGIAITRLVMQLAKQFTDAKSIKDIVPDQRARQIKELYHQEQAKPTSKIYPLNSDVAAVDLPNRALTDLLVQLYKLKVQPMYPALHEPTLDSDINTVYLRSHEATAHQHFICRMVIAISLQKMDTQYAGLADSYYLAALKFLEQVMQPMDMKTLQCFCLIAEYSLLTPTRTAIYYVVGVAVRLAQALGFTEEKTITRGRADGKVDFLEIDMRRRLFWCIFVMEQGLAHALGRPSIIATSQDHLDVGWFATCDDKYITPDGIEPSAPRSIVKKWIGMHFFKMRLLQLEIRRKLYQKKRPEPRNDSHPWFRTMDGKLTAWRDAAPSQDEGHGLDKVWFIGRYNTMVVFLYRPSPQVPRPSLEAALKCFDACEYNIYMHREQIAKKNVDLTWIFTQSIFMAINTILWSLSYAEVRRKHSRAVVEKHLEVAMESIELAIERWPGVASAVQLYTNLIHAIMKIYEKDGDVPIVANTPSDAASSPAMFPDAFNRSLTTSPATASSVSVSTPPEKLPAFGYINQQARRDVEQPPSQLYQNDLYPAHPAHAAQPTESTPTQESPAPDTSSMQEYIPLQQQQQSHYQHESPLFDPNGPFNPLPDWAPELNMNNWSPSQQYYNVQYPNSTVSNPMQPNYNTSSASHYPSFDASYPGNMYTGLTSAHGSISGTDQYMTQYWDMGSGGFGTGLTQSEQEELMHSLETDGMEDIQTMISSISGYGTLKGAMTGEQALV